MCLSQTMARLFCVFYCVIFRRDAALQRGTYIPRVKYVCVTVYDIPSESDRSRNLGSVSYSDTFVDSAFLVECQGLLQASY